MKPVWVWNRRTRKLEKEEVYGQGLVSFAYERPVGQFLAEKIFSRKIFSRLLGTYQSTQRSKKKIQAFIETFQIPMNEFEDAPYSSFNDFFIRRFKKESRPFCQTPSEMPAFAEGRYFAFDSLSPEETFPVKGIHLTAQSLLGDSKLAEPFEKGPILLARLCPTDYHRFHFPDKGLIELAYTVSGKLHSVNPLALQYKSDIFMTNERQVSLLSTENFGKLAFVEVGAICVGKIVQSFQGQTFDRGQEKGYFLFGGSTVIVFGEKGAWKPDSDLLEKTKAHQECLVRLGERVASNSFS